MNYKDKIYNSYRSSFKGQADNATLHSGSEKILPLISPWVCDLSRSSVVVDLGCGAGELLLAFKKFGFSQLGGCDLSAEQIEVARLNFPDVKKMDIFQYLKLIEDGSVDVTTIFDVVEHLGPQLTFELFAIVRRKLRDGGIIIVHLPNGDSPFVGNVFWGDMTHDWCLNAGSAKTLCRLFSFREFAAAEHLGESSNLKGRARKLAWGLVRSFYCFLNLVETGSSGNGIWTRNFVFKATK